MCCKKAKVSITARNKVLDPNTWTISVEMFTSCLHCNIHHLVDPVLQQAAFVRGNSSGFRSCKVACLVPVACDHVNLITGALKGHARNALTSDARRISNMLLSNVVHTRAHTRVSSSLELLRRDPQSVGLDALSCPITVNLEYCPRYVPDARVIFGVYSYES